MRPLLRLPRLPPYHHTEYGCVLLLFGRPVRRGIGSGRNTKHANCLEVGKTVTAPAPAPAPAPAAEIQTEPSLWESWPGAERPRLCVAAPCRYCYRSTGRTPAHVCMWVVCWLYITIAFCLAPLCANAQKRTTEPNARHSTEHRSVGSSALLGVSGRLWAFMDVLGRFWTF